MVKVTGMVIFAIGLSSTTDFPVKIIVPIYDPTPSPEGAAVRVILSDAPLERSEPESEDIESQLPPDVVFTVALHVSIDPCVPPLPTVIGWVTGNTP
jgi:hypothetical protein